MRSAIEVDKYNTIQNLGQLSAYDVLYGYTWPKMTKLEAELISALCLKHVSDRLKGREVIRNS